jgi:hypothetical protein
MKKLGALSLVSFLLFTSCLTAVAKKKEKEQEVKPATGFAIPYTKVVKGADRFENAPYFTLMASDGIRKVDAKALYERLQVAVAADERYKALYLARILTDLKPETATVWSNRAQLASALGLAVEAAACEQNAKNPSQRVPVSVADILPGTALKTKPTTLSDWAAAAALLSDGIAEKEGKQALVAFKDLLSGVHEATQEEINERNEEFKESGLNPPGPWATPEPVQLRQVLANSFDLRGAEPMHNVSVSKGGMFGAMLMAGLSGMQQNMNPMMAQQTMDVAQQMAGRASQVPSHYKGGSYTRVVFDEGKEVAALDHPQTAGEDEAVGEPLPFLWASAGSTEPYFSGDWKTTHGTKVRKITASNLDDVKDSHAKRYNPPAELRFPKLMSLCTVTSPTEKSCSNPLSLMELLLTRDDVATLAPDLAASLVDVARFRGAYDSATLILNSGNGGGQLMWGVDNDGAMFQLSTDPTSWLTGAR